MHDVARQGGREHQGAALGRGGLEDEGQVLVEAHVQHLVGFIQHDGLQGRQVQRPALEVVAQTTGRADDDVTSAVQRLALDLGVHAADAGDDPGPGLGVQPLQLVRNLQRQLAGRGDDQGHRRAEFGEFLGLAQQGGGQGQAEGHGLARAGLGADQQVAAGAVLVRRGVQNSRLNRRGLGVAAFGKGAVERGMTGGEGHGAVQ